MEIVKRPDRKIQARLYWGSRCSRGEGKQQVPLLVHLLGVEGVVSWLLLWRGGGSRPRSRPEGWLRWSAHPLVGLCAGGALYPAFAFSTLLLLSVLQKWQLGF